MRFTVSAVLALATTAFAQTADFNKVTAPTPNEVIPAGSPFEVVWSVPGPYTGKVAISLIGGDDQGSQVPLSDIATVDNSDLKYSWNVDSSLGAENVYGLVFKLVDNPDIMQYSNPFTIKAGGSPDDGGSSSDVTVIVTTATGVKTVTIESCPPTTTSTTSTSTSTSTTSTSTTSTTPTSTPTPTHTWHTTTVQNTTVAYTPKPTYVLPPPSTAPVAVPPPATTTAPAVVPPTDTPGAAPRVGAGSMALVAGLALAALAL